MSVRHEENDSGNLKSIVEFCKRADQYAVKSNNDLSSFSEDFMCRDACSFCVLSISMCASNLSDDLRSDNPGVDWTEVESFGGSIDVASADCIELWNIITKKLPDLKKKCMAILIKSYSTVNQI